MQQAPLELGSALVTGSGRLRDRGIRAVIHAVVHPTLGAPARLATVRRATAASLRAAEAHRLRSVAMPVLGGGRGPEHPDHDALTNAVVEEIVAHLRRSPTRLERVFLVSRLPAETATVATAIAIARQQSWSSIP